MRRLPWLQIFLFCVTFLTTLVAGALLQGADIVSRPESIVEGFPFSATLLAILLCHEFAHFFAARRHGVSATLPYFIPMPTLIGTMGAFIRMRSPITTRDALIDIGASGPLAGFGAALIACVYGLSLTVAAPASLPAEGEFMLGESYLFSMLSRLVLGVATESADIVLHPVALAGWIGLFITSLNLLPIGQLDGGHISYALLGRRHKILSIATIGGLVVLGILFWSGWLVLAGVMVVIGIKHPPVMHAEQQLDPRRRAVGLICGIVAGLTFIPAPFSII